MKKVFSTHKYLEIAIQENWEESSYKDNLAPGGWAFKCEGLTEREMKKLGFFTSNDWMEEVFE